MTVREIIDKFEEDKRTIGIINSLVGKWRYRIYITEIKRKRDNTIYVENTYYDFDYLETGSFGSLELMNKRGKVIKKLYPINVESINSIHLVTKDFAMRISDFYCNTSLDKGDDTNG